MCAVIVNIVHIGMLFQLDLTPFISIMSSFNFRRPNIWLMTRLSCSHKFYYWIHRRSWKQFQFLFFEKLHPRSSYLHCITQFLPTTVYHSFEIYAPSIVLLLELHKFFARFIYGLGQTSSKPIIDKYNIKLIIRSYKLRFVSVIQVRYK